MRLTLITGSSNVSRSPSGELASRPARASRRARARIFRSISSKFGFHMASWLGGI